jgi:DNA-binding response OmpR family regulator
MLAGALKRDRFRVEFGYSAKEGLLKFNNNQYVLIVLGAIMQDMDGLEVLQRIRATSGVPVLMLYTESEVTDKIYGLRLGADDYMTIPFEMKEFAARVHSLIRRYTVLNHVSDEKKTLVFNSLQIDPNQRLVVANGCKIEMQAKEFDILFYLAQNCNRVYTKKQIYEKVWQKEYMYDDNNIMAHISKIRKQLRKSSANIQNVRGVGYRFVEDNT